jgi:hypothetical protein
MKRTAVMILMTAVPTAAGADDAMKVVAAPRDFIGQQVAVPCLITYAQPETPTWCEVYDASGKEAGTILFYLINLAQEQDRARAMKDCGNQNPSKNNRERCMVTLTGKVGVQFQKAFLTDPTVEWANK